MASSTATLKVARDYFISSQSTVLIPNRNFGSRKLVNVGINKQPKVRKPDIDPNSITEGAELTENYFHLDPGQSTVGDLDSGCYTPSDLDLNNFSSMQTANKNKHWVHPPETLLRGHIVYLVKFLGESEVEIPKGTEVVKDAIRKRKFQKHIKKAEGQKTPKVELTISADGVTIQNPKSKMIMHQYPLHRISYCADDKSDKRMLTFIAKAGDSERHFCYVFASDKCAEEITLTIGQAFDLAYRRFLDTSSRDFDFKKKYIMLQKKANGLEKENITLKVRVRELEGQLNIPHSDVNNHENNVQYENTSPPQYENTSTLRLGQSSSLVEESTDDPVYSEIKAPKKQTSVGRRLENLLFDPYTNGDSNSNSNLEPPTTNGTSSSAILSPPPPSSKSRAHNSSTPTTPSTPSNNKGGLDAFDSTPFGASTNPFNSFGAPQSVDPFGMESFNPNSTMDLDKALQNINDEFNAQQTGFSQGITFGTDDLMGSDFSLADLDPLNQK